MSCRATCGQITWRSRRAPAPALRLSLPPNQFWNFKPVLQAQDGSFVGAADVGDARTPSMLAFDASGNVRWSVPNETPQIATADGGVIGKSGITYDQNGNATRQMASLPIQAWTGNTYQVRS